MFSVLFSLQLMTLATPEQSVTELDRVSVSLQLKQEQDQEPFWSLSRYYPQEGNSHVEGDLSGLSQWIPSLVTEEQGGVRQLSMRGLGSGGRHIGFGGRVALYWDGLYMGPSAALSLSPWVVDQVDAFYGAQGAWSSRPAVGGALYMHSRSLWDESEGWDVGMGLHDEGRWRWVAHGTQEAGLHRFQGLLFQEEGPLDEGETRRHSGQVEWGWQWHPDATVEIALDRHESVQSSRLGSPVSGFLGSPIFNSDDQGDLSQEEVLLGGVRLEGTWSYDGHQIAWRLGDRRLKQERSNDLDYQSADLARLHYQDEWDMQSQELVWSYREGPWSTSWGVSHYADNAQSNRVVRVGVDSATPIRVPGVPIALPFQTVFAVAPGAQVSNRSRIDLEGWSTFSHIRFSGDRWDLGAALRWNHETRDLNMNLNGQGSGRLNIGTLTLADVRQKEVHVHPSVQVIRYTEQGHWFANASTSHKPGGWNVDFLTPQQITQGLDFQDEHARSIEMGYRYTGNPELNWEVRAFHNRIQDMQVFQFQPANNGTTLLQLTNAAQAESMGVEWQGSWSFHDDWRLSGHAQWMKAQFNNFPGGGSLTENLRGNELPEAPSWGGRLSLDYMLPYQEQGAWTANLSWHARDGYYLGAENRGYERVATQQQWDAHLSWTHPGQTWTVKLFAHNLLDQEHVSYRNRDFFGHLIEQTNPGRSYSLQLQYRF